MQMKSIANRSDYLYRSTGGGIPWIAHRPNTERWLPRMTFFSPHGIEPKGDILVVVFQRGGMDALNAVIPHAESQYYNLRPTLAIAEPKSGQDNAAIDLDGFFGFHPALRSLKDIWDNGALALVHASGSPDPTHSHFDAMDFMERGTPGHKQISSGWLSRHLQTAASENDSPFRAVGIGHMLPSSLMGAFPATALQSIANFHLGGAHQTEQIAEFQASLIDMYRSGSSLDSQAELTFNVSDTLASIVEAGYQPANEAEYPDSRFGGGLMQIAQLIKAEVGLEVAALDIGGWDTHAGQGALSGSMPSLLTDFADSLSAFYFDLGEKFDKVTVVTMSEFGRRLEENGNGGTDHGHGGVMFLMGNNINGGKVYGDWPGLSSNDLYGPGDLEITTDFRNILAEIIQNRLLNDSIDQIFPNYANDQILGVTNL